MRRACTLTRLLATVAVLVAIVSVPAAMAAEKAYPSSAPGGESLPPADDSDNYGTLTTSALWLPASQFNPHDTGVTYIRTGGAGAGATARTGGTGQFWAPVNLPTGAVVTRVEIHHFDNLAAQTGFHCLTRYLVDNQYNLQETCILFPAGTPGITTFGFAPAAAIATIDNRNPYVVHVFVDSNSPTYHFWGVRVVYRLNISAAPATATFPTDVPTTHPLFRFVEALAASGITGGCGPGQFCPDSPLTRGQMAVFLATALGLHFPDAPTIP